jgi:hypothetical protein
VLPAQDADILLGYRDQYPGSTGHEVIYAEGEAKGKERGQ